MSACKMRGPLFGSLGDVVDDLTLLGLELTLLDACWCSSVTAETFVYPCRRDSATSVRHVAETKESADWWNGGWCHSCVCFCGLKACDG